MQSYTQAKNSACSYARLILFIYLETRVFIKEKELV